MSSVRLKVLPDGRVRVWRTASRGGGKETVVKGTDEKVELVGGRLPEMKAFHQNGVIPQKIGE